MEGSNSRQFITFRLLMEEGRRDGYLPEGSTIKCRFFTVAPAGNRTGMDPFSGRILTDIPHSGFGDESVEQTRLYYLLLINSPVSGSYETHVVGVTEAPFEVNFPPFQPVAVEHESGW